MRASRALAFAIGVFALGLLAAVIGMKRYSDAYAWVAHTSDVRLVIGRAVGHAGRTPSCEGLRSDVAELAELTTDNPKQRARILPLRTAIDDVCANHPVPQLVEQLAELDATERALMTERRLRLATTRTQTLLALVLSTLGAIAAVLGARMLQRRATSALVASEERFRMMASSANDLIRIHDTAGKATYVSPSVERLLGYTPAELLAEVPLSLGHPEDLERMRQSLVEIKRDHAPATTLVYRLRAKDGTYRWFETHTNPVRDESGKLLRFYTVARDVTDRIELEQKLETAAVTDELTGLLNRRGFLLIAGQAFRVAVRQKQGVAVIFADLDGLKTINDRLGHEHGDQAIRALAEVLRTTFRESDVLARLGGDEFAVFAYNTDQDKIDIVLDRVRFAVARAPAIGPYPLSVSLGVAILPAGGGKTLDELIAEADQRMYETKRAKKAG